MSPRRDRFPEDPTTRALELELERLHDALERAWPAGSAAEDAPVPMGPLALHWPCLGVHLWELPWPGLEETARRLGTSPPRRRRLEVTVNGNVAVADVWRVADEHGHALLLELVETRGSAHAVANHARRTARAIEGATALRA